MEDEDKECLRGEMCPSNSIKEEEEGEEGGCWQSVITSVRAWPLAAAESVPT